MKRFLLLGWLTGWFVCSSFGQITSLNGRIEYRHEYADVLTNGFLSTSVTRTPLFSLNTGGYLVSQRLARFSLSTDFAASGSDSRSGALDYTVKQYSWDFYRLSLNILPFSPVKMDLTTRAGRYEVGSELTIGSYFTRNNRDEQTASVSTNRIAWLPTAQLSFRRTHTYSVAGTATDITDRHYGFVLSSAADIASINVVGGLSDIVDREFNTRTKVYDLSLDATREYSELSRFDLGAVYTRYDAYSLLTGNASYTNSELERFTTSTSVYGSNSASEFFRAYSAGGRENLSYAPAENVRLTMSASGRAGQEIRFLADGPLKLPTYDVAFSTGVSRSGEIDGFRIGNGLSLGYTRQKISEAVTGLSGSVSNSVATRAGAFDLSGDYAISGGIQYNGIRTSNVTNRANAYATGRLWRIIQSTTAFNFRDDRFAGYAVDFRDYRLISLRQTFRTSGYYLIPFSAELSGSVNWYSRSSNGRTYGWTAGLQSGSFFVRGLGLDYRYNRTFDLFYRFEVVTQSARMTYRWRMVLLELRLSELRTLDRRRDVWFSIIRPF